MNMASNWKKKEEKAKEMYEAYDPPEVDYEPGIHIAQISLSR